MKRSMNEGHRLRYVFRAAKQLLAAMPRVRGVSNRAGHEMEQRADKEIDKVGLIKEHIRGHSHAVLRSSLKYDICL